MAAMATLPAKVTPSASASASAVAAAEALGVSREDMRNTLHTYFRSRPIAAASTASTSSATRRQRVYSFVQVQKRKVSLGSKRLFGAAGGPPKAYVLCVTVQDGAGGAAHLHYVQFLRALAVEVRQSWDIGRLDVLENAGVAPDRKRGSFALLLDGEEAPWQWVVDDRERKTAMLEFLWSLCALALDRKKMLPRLVRFNLEELHETALLLNLQHKYGIDVDLLDHMAAVKKQRADGDDNQDEEGSIDTGDKSGVASAKTQADRKAAGAPVRLTDAENADANALLANVNWADAHLASVEDTFRRKLRALEDDNISFLLSFEGHNQPPAAGAKVSGGSDVSRSSSTAVDRIVAAIDALQHRVAQTQRWTDESDDFLQQTSANMLHFEALNNQLEVHFRNSVALQDALERMMAKVDVSREHMERLQQPVGLFPDDVSTAEGTLAVVSNPLLVQLTPEARRNLNQQLTATLTMLAKVDDAIKSTREFPASEMAAFRTRGDELSKLARVFSDKLCAAFDAFLQRKTRQWTLYSMAQAVARSSSASVQSPPPRGRVSLGSTASRESRDISSASTSSSFIVARGSIEASRFGRAITSFEEPAREMDWSFSNEPFHATLTIYEPLLTHLQSLDAHVVTALRAIYAKNAASVYGPHLQSLFRCLRDKLPRNPKTHFSKPQALQSWSFHLSSTHLGDALGASPLLQQALDHLVPLILREQRLLISLFLFADGGEVSSKQSNDAQEEPEALAPTMDAVFDKLLKRLIEFGEAAAARNVLDALALVVLINGQLDAYRQQSEFLFNTMVSFQLQMKRVLIKFTEDQELWINNHHPDTRMAGVLGPIQKTMTMIGRLEESVCGKTDDSALGTIYHRLLPATLQWLEKVADSKPKYASLVRLENYYFISDRLVGINAALDLPLGQYAAETRAKFEESAQQYVAYIWVYEFKQVEPLFAALEELLVALPAQEIQYHTPRQDVRKELEALAPSFEKSVRNMHTRMKKHFTVQPKSLPMIWQRLVAYGKTRLQLYEQIAAQCYQLRLEPSPQRGSEVLGKFATA